MSFRLKFYAAKAIGDSLPAIIPAVYSRIGAAPDLLDGFIGMDFLSVEIHGHFSFLKERSLVVKTGSPEIDVIGIPFAQAIVSLIGGSFFVDNGSHPVCGGVAI